MENDIIHLMTCNRIISVSHSFLNVATKNPVRSVFLQKTEASPAALQVIAIIALI